MRECTDFTTTFNLIKSGLRRGIPPHECLVHRISQMEDVVADRQVMLQAERREDNSVPHRKCKAQFFRVWKKNAELH